MTTAHWQSPSSKDDPSNRLLALLQRAPVSSRLSLHSKFYFQKICHLHHSCRPHLQRHHSLPLLNVSHPVCCLSSMHRQVIRRRNTCHSELQRGDRLLRVDHDVGRLHDGVVDIQRRAPADLDFKVRSCSDTNTIF